MRRVPHCFSGGIDNNELTFKKVGYPIFKSRTVRSQFPANTGNQDLTEREIVPFTKFVVLCRQGSVPNGCP